MKIRMLKNVRPDLPLAKPGTILRAGEEYEAKSNKNGAISGLCANGEYLGVRPGEFVFTEAPIGCALYGRKYIRRLCRA